MKIWRRRRRRGEHEGEGERERERERERRVYGGWLGPLVELHARIHRLLF